MLSADPFINFPILKHHRTDLHRCIAALAAFKKPHLTIVDAIRGITDNGPGADCVGKLKIQKV